MTTQTSLEQVSSDDIATDAALDALAVAEAARDTAVASAASAANSASTASDSETGSISIYDELSTLYLGSKVTAPTLDNDGNALISGAEYFNSVLNTKYTWNGSSWIATSFVDYEEYTVDMSLDSSFTGGTLTAVRIGRSVTLSIINATVPDDGSPTYGTLPVAFRPEAFFIVFTSPELSSFGQYVEMNTDGTIRFRGVQDNSNEDVGNPANVSVSYLTA